MKKLFLGSFGCQMNERDSEAVQGLLLDRGFEAVFEPESADLILYNTCSVRDHAEQKIFGRMGTFAKLKEKNPNLIIGIMGCMAQEHGGKFFKKNPEIDLVCGPGNLSQIPDIVEEIQEKRSPRLAIDKLDDEYGLEGVRYRSSTFKSLITIMKGCDHRCTYCIVPYVRGKEVSRSSESILREAKDLSDRQFKEVMLLGQNVNSYGKGLEENIDFAGLLEKIQAEAPNLSRIRFITSHPKDAHTRLFQVMKDLPSVCEQLHLPVQSGSNAVLKRMKREHTIEWYLQQIDEYRALMPKGSLSTDIIVGFPGETEEDFQDTYRLMERAQFDSAYIFTYSPRPGTPALKLQDDVKPEVKHRRLQELLVLQRAMVFQNNQKFVGETCEVLFDSLAKRDSNRYVGRTREYKRVVVSSDQDLVGQFKSVKILSVLDETLLGELAA